MKPPFEAYTGSEAFLFVCYAHEDRGTVYPELRWLRDQGFNIWYDEGIAPGEEWPDRIARAIEQAEHFLFYVTPSSAASRVCRDEVNLALAEHKPVTTVYLKPTTLTGGLKLSLSTSQALVRDHFRSLGDYRRQLKGALLDSGPELAEHNESSARSPAVYATAILILALVFSAIGYRAFTDRDSIEPPTDTAQESGQEAVSPATVMSPIDSVAVLPLRDMSAERDLDYLGEGMAEELIHALTQVDDIQVVARTSSFFFKNQQTDIQSIGQQLGVNSVLEGSVQRAGDDLRITLQLIDVSNGFHIWSQRYDSSLQDIFRLQDEIAQQVVRAIRPDSDSASYSDLADAGTNNGVAYEAFLLGNYERSRQSRDSIDRAIEYFQLALSHDPMFFQAYELLIDAYDFKGFYYGQREEMLSLAERTLAEAKAQLPGQHPERWYWMERLVATGTRNPQRFDDAETLFSLMLRDPSHPANRGYTNGPLYSYALLLAKSGLLRPAIEIMQNLERGDPLNVSIKLRLAEFLIAAERSDEAIAKYNDLLQVSPRYVQAQLDLFLLHGKLQNLHAATELRAQLAEVFSGDLVLLLDAYLLHFGGDTEGALERLDSLRESDEVPANYKAVTYLALGETDRAFEFFNLAADQLDPYVSELAITQARALDPERWRALRETQQYRDFMARFGVDDRWVEELVLRANRNSRYTGVEVSLGDA